jgi:hypothetical protein
MTRFEVLKTPEGYAVRELPEEQSMTAMPRKSRPVSYTAQQLLDFMFTEGVGCKFIPGPVAQ